MSRAGLGALFRNHGRYSSVQIPVPDEHLTGFVQGKDARTDEERFFRSMMKSGRVTGFKFRQIFGTPQRSMAGAIELDYFINIGGWYLAVQIDGDRFHQSAFAIQRDMNQDAQLLRIVRRWGVDRIQRMRADYLITQDRADRTFAQLLMGRVFSKWS